MALCLTGSDSGNICSLCVPFLFLMCLYIGALTVALEAAITNAATIIPNAKQHNHYRDAKKAPDRVEWKAACDLQMKKRRERNCWSVVKRGDIPKVTRVMGSRWTFKYKRNETGGLLVSHRSRFVDKCFTQINNVKLLRKLRTRCFFWNTRCGLRFNSSATFPRQPLRHVSRIHRK